MGPIIPFAFSTPYATLYGTLMALRGLTRETCNLENSCIHWDDTKLHSWTDSISPSYTSWMCGFTTFAVLSMYGVKFVNHGCLMWYCMDAYAAVSLHFMLMMIQTYPLLYKLKHLVLRYLSSKAAAVYFSSPVVRVVGT